MISLPQALDMELLHEVPIRVMRAADIQYYMPPDVAMPRVQLELPYNRSMRTVLEVGRKSGSHNACVRIAGNGWRPYGGLDRSLECLFRRAAPFCEPYGPLLMTESCLLSPSISRLSSCSTQRFKIMDRFCFVDGDMSGALRLRLQNDRCHVQTFYRYFKGNTGKRGGAAFKNHFPVQSFTHTFNRRLYFLTCSNSNLIPRYVEGMTDGDEDMRRTEEGGSACCSIKLDSRKFLSALHFMTMKYDSAICCMIEESCLVLHVTLAGHVGTLTLYLPMYLV
jgi:hypothetical protein